MRIKLFIISSLFVGNCFAQQEPQFTMNWNTYSFNNPASTGLFYKHFATFIHRSQWTGLDGAPQTIGGIYDFKWSKINSGVGLNYIFGKLGFEKNNRLYLNYAYQFNLKKERVLSAGLAIGFLEKSIDFSKFVTIDPNDPLLSASTNSDVLFNCNIGVLYKTPHVNCGLSITQLNQPESEVLHYKNSRHYFVTFTYIQEIGKSFIFRPNILVKSDFSSTQYDFNLVSIYRKRYWAGLTYRISDAIAFMAGVDIKGRYRIGYSYDYTISELNNFSKGSHEIVIAFMTN